MFKKLFMVVLFMMLSVTVLPEVAKADAYEYENINELVNSVASVINKKNTYELKYSFNGSDCYIELNTIINWKTKTVSFNGFMFRPETYYKKEKFSAVLDLKSDKVKTSSKAYKEGKSTISAFIHQWNLSKDSEYRKSLGHYLLDHFGIVDEDTVITEFGDKVLVSTVSEEWGNTWTAKIITSKSKVIEMELYDSNNIIKVKMK